MIRVTTWLGVLILLTTLGVRGEDATPPSKGTPQPKDGPSEQGKTPAKCFPTVLCRLIVTPLLPGAPTTPTRDLSRAPPDIFKDKGTVAVDRNSLRLPELRM
jgi:hypothetical protein